MYEKLTKEVQNKLMDAQVNRAIIEKMFETPSDKIHFLSERESVQISNYQFYLDEYIKSKCEKYINVKSNEEKEIDDIKYRMDFLLKKSNQIYRQPIESKSLEQLQDDNIVMKKINDKLSQLQQRKEQLGLPINAMKKCSWDELMIAQFDAQSK